MSVARTPETSTPSLAEQTDRADRLALRDWPVGFLWGSATAAAQLSKRAVVGGTSSTVIAR